MVFSSFTFIFVFLPILLLIYYLVPAKNRNTRNTVLLIFSLVFYAFGGVQYLGLMVGSIILNYIGGLLCERNKRKLIWLWVCIGINLGLLIWFKYIGFFSRIIQQIGVETSVLEIVLPIGISFYTFQGISYVVDVYRGDTKAQKNPIKLGLYIALFSQLIAGPIVRYSDIQVALISNREHLSLVSDGFVRFSYGLAKKMLLASAFGKIADEIFGMPDELWSVSVTWIGALAYTMQIYFDFSAYSDMAIGLGKIFGFSFPENFNAPYTAVSITDFWHRWHITLSSWFRDYVYIPLGGNRVKRGKHIINLMIVWILTGFWHGAEWTFLLWGLWYGVMLIGEKYIWGKGFNKLPYIIKRVLTMLVIIFGWVIFRSDSITEMLLFVKSMFIPSFNSIGTQSVYYFIEYWPEWIASLAVFIPYRTLVPLQKWKEKMTFRLLKHGVAIVLFVISYAALITGTFNPFLYYRF